MSVILIGMIFYVMATAWDVVHVNGLMEKLVNPGRREPAPNPEPAPRLVIPGQSVS